MLQINTRTTLLQPEADTQPIAVSAEVSPSSWPNLHAADTHVVSATSHNIRRLTVLRLLRNPSVAAGGALLSLIIIAAALAPVLYPGDPLSMVAPTRMPTLTPIEVATTPIRSDTRAPWNR
ncbi:MAG: ABC transporter permease, partial [Bradyrhizobium sp.]